MGQQVGGAVLSIGGSIVGGAIGGPIGAAVGGMAGGLIGSLLFNRNKKPLIPDYQLAGSSYGHPIPIIYGQVRLAANVFWETEIQTQTHSIGGKGFGGGSASKYLQSAGFAFCEGVARPIKLWLDGKLFYDTTALVPQEYTKYKFPVRVYTGTEDQLPDPLIQIWVEQRVIPFNACPAYRGLCYLVFDQIDLSHFGNRMPNVSATWATNAPESVIVKKLSYWPDDTDISQFVPAYSGGVTIDWTRLYVYTLSYTGIARCFDIRTGLCITKVDLVPLLSMAGPLNLAAYGPYDSGNWPLSAIAAEPGGDVYVANIPKLDLGTLTWTEVYIWRLDAGLSTVISQVHVPKYLLSNNYVADLKAFDLVAPTGVFTMMVGRWVVGPPFIIDPNFGYYSGALPVAYSNSWYVVGKQDEIAGTVDVWILNATFVPFDQPLLIYKAFVTGNDVSALVAMGNFKQMGSITPADYGLASPAIYSPTSIGVIYDAADDTLIISDFLLNATIKWSPNVGVVWVQPRFTLEPNQMQSNVDTAAGRFANAFTNGTRTIWVDETFAGAEQSVYSSADLGLGASIGATWGYDSGLNGIVFATSERSSSQLYIAYLQRYTGERVRVADIITDLCERVGMTADMIDVSEVTQTTAGYMVADQKGAGQAIADLCHTYQIDMVESDYVLRFIPRGGAPIVTITQDDLASPDTQDSGKFWEAKRAQEQELPLQINVRYNDPSLDFQPGASYAKRTALPVPTQFSKRVQTVDLPVVCENAEARHIAEQWLYTLWAERDTYKTKLGWKYLFLDPTDNITVNLDSGDSFTVRIETTEIGADFVIDAEMASEDATTYLLSRSPGASVSFTPQTLQPAAFVDLIQWNSPLLQDSDDLGGTQSRIYYAAGPTTAVASSASATLYQSTDAATWNNFNATTGFADWGRATSALADTPAKFAADFVNTVTVVMANGSSPPASCSYTDMMNGANAALLGQEIIQFQDVTTNPDGSLTLSTIVRGRRGTEWATGLHANGEIFLLLAVGEVTGTRLPLTQVNVREFWKLVPLNSVLTAVPTDTFEYRGFDLMPYAPVNFQRLMSGADLVITWIRRTRLGGGEGVVIDTTDTAPLAEASESYELYILPNSASINSFDPTNAGTYLRKFPQVRQPPISSPTVTYTAAMMAADGFNPLADTLYLVGFQLSAVVGRGFPGYEVVSTPAVIGSAVVGPTTITLFPSGIPSAEAIGTPGVGGAGVTPGTITLSPAGVASSEAVGTPIVSVAGSVVTVPSFIPIRYRGLYYIDSVSNPAAIGAAPFDVKVIEPTSDGGTIWWTSSDVTAMKSQTARPGAKVFAYMDFGEWEDFRDYSQSGAAPAGTDPNLWGIGLSVLKGPVNPSWPGDFPVAFWDPAWHNVCFKYVEKAISLGFDGLYLDVVDSSQGTNSAWTVQNAPANAGAGAGTQAAANNACLDLIEAMRTHAHAINPNFLIAANGCDPLFAYNNRYANAIDVWWMEEVFFDDFSTTPHNYSAIVANIAKAQAAKPSLPMAAVEYIGTGTAVIQTLRTLCQTYNLGYYVADNIDLNDICMAGINAPGPPPPLP